MGGRDCEYILKLVEPHVKAVEELDIRQREAPLNSDMVYRLTILADMDKQKAEEAHALMVYKELDAKND